MYFFLKPKAHCHFFPLLSVNFYNYKRRQNSYMEVSIKKRCAIYIRVSTEEQHLNGLSLPAQKKALTEYAHSHDYIIVKCYADEGISARKSMKYRKGLLSLLADVKEDKIDMILVTKLDRWFRNISDYNTTEEILRAHHCCWKTIFENYDSSTANGQMVINIMLSVNQAECDRTSERIKAVLDYKRSIGEVTSGRCACYGYRIKDNRLVKDESVSHIVDDAFSHYFVCCSIRDTIRYLEEKYGEEAPSPGKIRHLFRNETYAGRDKDNLNYCEPYISPEQFDRIRQITGSKTYSGSSQPYLFSSLIKCPWCGSRYSGYRKKYKRRDGVESFYIRYRCGSNLIRHSCAHLTEHKIEEFLLSQIFRKLSQEQIYVQMKKPKDRFCADTSSCTFTGSWLTLYQELDRPHRRAFWKNTIKDITLDSITHKISGFHFL